MIKYFLSTVLLLSVSGETGLAKSLNPNLKKVENEKRMPAASGISELPAKGSALTRLVKDVNPEIESVISLYKKTERFNGAVLKNGKKEGIFVDFIQAGRYETDAPTANNLIIIKSNGGPNGGEGEPFVFVVGPIEISSIKKISDSKFIIKGSGGNAVSSDGKCTFVGVERTLTIEISLEANQYDYALKYIDAADKQWCSK